MFHITWLSDSADDSSSLDTRLGVIDERTESENPPKPATTAAPDVHQDDGRFAAARAREEECGSRRLSTLADEEQTSAVMGVDDRTAEQCGERQGHELHDPDEPDRRGRPRDREDLHVDRDQRDL